MMLIVQLGADRRRADRLVGVIVGLTAPGRSVVVAVLRRRSAVHVRRIVVRVRHEMVWEMVLIKIASFALRRSGIIDSLVEMRLI